MGLETAAAVMAGVSAASELGKAVAQWNTAKSKTAALDLQGKEQMLMTEQKTLGNYDVAQKVLDAQIAHQTITGTTLDSPSFSAMQRETFNITARKQGNIDIEGEIANENIKLEKQNVRNSLFAQLFGDVSETAMSAFNAYSKMPTGG